ncbi:MAG: ABC transporter ATP-binding protein [Desulfobacteraceae bacterium]|nr:ABC transporter ATP-binding protein [Desulfobacteraceae bacterium]MBC2749745.1 ABC transporter ATP-binding protein [Desulfobacteraceae bacterium]
MTVSVPPVLTLNSLSKRFGDVYANRAVSWTLQAGRIYALLGENGAGKSTLMSILSGRYQPDSGGIQLKGRPVHFQSPAQALEMGIGMVYQRFMLVDSLTVTENILLRGGPIHLRANQDIRHIRELAERYGLAVKPEMTVRDLSMGERQRVEILKLLHRRADILIFDEPTAVLTHTEIEGLFAVFRRLRAEGKTIIFITHKLEEVMAVADDIAVMRRGRMVSQLPADKVRSRHDLARLMVGREVILNVDKPPVTVGDPVMTASGLTGPAGTSRPAFQDIDFDVRRGEIFTITGVAGNGQEALVAALAGLAPLDGGTVTFGNHTYSAARWRQRPASGMAYIPEDRDRTGSIGAFSLVENYILTQLNAFGRSFLVDRHQAEQKTAEAVARFQIRGGGILGPAGHLSGGNLQKLILARELSRRPDLLIAEQPTQGLDVQATEDVWQALLRQRKTSAVLMVTGDLKEALSLSDRIAVMFRGRILDIVSARDTADIDRIKLLMAGIEAH